VTAAGKKAFTRWLSDPASHDQLRNPLLLRAAFGEAAGAATLRDLYAAKTDEHTSALLEARELLKDAKQSGDRFGQATLDFAVTYHRAVLKWLDSAPVS
jgi:hypothetical protein